MWFCKGEHPSCLMLEQPAENSCSMSPFPKPSGEPFLCILFPPPLPTKWPKTKSDLKLLFSCLNRPELEPSLHAMLIITFDSPDLHPHDKKDHVLQPLQLIMCVFGRLFFFLHGKFRKHFEQHDFPRFCIHYFLIIVMDRSSHDTIGALTEITAEQSPFTRTGPLSPSPTPFWDILWFWQKLSFWNLKELY